MKNHSLVSAVAALMASALFLSMSSAGLRAAPVDDLTLIKKQYRDYLQEVMVKNSKDELVLANEKSLKPDGTWPDVPYELTSTSNSVWKTMTHLERLEGMALAYTNPNSKLHGDPALAAAIHSALGFWLAKDLRNPNWWYNEIGVPMDLSQTLLVLDQEVKPDELAAGLKIIARADETKNPTGQNLVWVSGNTLTRGLLQNDLDLVRAKRDIIASQIVVTPDEGIEPDFSFHQHGPQQQFGNYGLAFVDDCVQWMLILRGTSLAFDTDPVKSEIFRNYLLKGQDWVVWKGVMDISACGRQLIPNSPASKASNLRHAMMHMALADPTHAAAYQASVDRNSPEAATAPDTLTGNRFFWFSDYMVHRRPTFYVSTKLSSNRVVGTECVNDENLQGLHLADGGTYVYVTGQEYKDISPIWDWSRIPGVTCLQVTDKAALRPPNIFSGEFKTAMAARPNFVGGVSDGTIGAAATNLVTPDLSAHKSWFYFDDQVVCLGAGINSTQATNVVTSVNQCLAKGEATVVDAGGEKSAAAGWQGYAGLKSAWHDGLGYLFLDAGKVMLGVQPQSGSWSEVTKAGKSDKLTEDVFSIWIDHGAQPKDAHYAYAIYPAIAAADWKTKSAQPSVTVLRNTPEIQAVRNPSLGLTMAAFFQPGTLQVAGAPTIVVDQPCVLLFREHEKTLTVADPTQKLTELSVTINGTAAKITLPTDTQAGSSLTQAWK